ncbi:MAG: methyl-accepting chemotaxis protein [Lachnospiraceae bacterium]|nr:methyl-accepting chemotaxis protein [Lachnospiraceae bacterium]
MFQNEKIQGRLTKSFRMVSLIGAIAAVLGVIMLAIVMTQYKSALVNYGFSQGDIGKAMVTFADSRSAARGIIGYNSDDLIKQMTETRDTKKEAFEKYWEEVGKTLTTKQEKELYDSANASLEKYWNSEQKAIATGKTTDNEQSIKGQELMRDEVGPLYDEVYADMAALMDANVTQGDKLALKLEIVSIIFIIVIIAIIAIGIVVSTRLGASIAKGIAGPIQEFEARLKTFAQGNLHDPFPEIKSNDEVAAMITTANEMADTLNAVINDAGFVMEQMSNGNYAVSSEYREKYVGDFEKLLVAMRVMRDQMIGTIQSISEASAQVSAGATNLAESSQSMAEGATDQAGAVEELQATITSITDNIDHAAEDAHGAYEQAQKYAEEAGKSSEEMKAMVDAMTRIDETSKKIGDIISEIEDIASQTNLLSLNASIEAARAGEAGRGFAVVADQIRQLAEQTTKSAVNTRDLIEGALQEIEDGNKAADRAAQSIADVVDGIQKIAESSKGISEVARGQADAMDQAEAGVNQISEVIQNNSAAAEESSATSQELSAQATSLDDLVSKFVLPEE